MPRVLRLILVVLFAVGAVIPAAHAATHKKQQPTRPLEYGVSVPDPSVIQSSKTHYVVVGTGANVVRLVSRNGRRWHVAADALPVRPSWAIPGQDIWAADVRKIGPRYVLYFAAPVKGTSPTSRCIGVATSPTVDGVFTPVGDAPLVCPPDMKTPPAEDQVLDPASYADQPPATPTPPACTPNPTPAPTDAPCPTSTPTSTSAPWQPEPVLPAIGVIDPSLFVNDGVPYLLYKTDGTPSSVRIVQLSGSGLHVAPGAVSTQVLSSGGVIENPVITVHKGFFYLFDAFGDYARCSYATVWRRSRTIAGLAHAGGHTILSRARTKGLCGPGGADVIGRAQATTIYFHAWTCHHSRKPCPATFHGWPDAAVTQAGAVRALYGAKITWSRSGMPRLGAMIQGPK